MKQLLTGLLLTLGMIFVLSTTAAADEWYRGNLHMHSYWSDGGVFPEEAVSLYRDAGYNFVCLSDHNQSQTDPARYKEIAALGSGKIRPKAIERFKQRYPNYPVEIQKRMVGDVETEFARIKMFNEFKKLVEVPNQFILLPGFEPSGGAKNGVQVHANIINTEKAFPFESLVDEHKTMDSLCARSEILRRGSEKETILFLNHPDWIYFDIPAEMIIPRNDFQFFELINCGPSYPAPEKAWTTEKFWDVVNAWRIGDATGPLLYGIATDDTHGYDHFYVNPQNSGDGFIMVRANQLTPQALIDAMYSGDFYASSGLRLKDVQFDKTTKTLTVEVAPEEGVDYTIHFIGTKKGFDKKTTSFDDPATGKKPARTIPVYSDSIGETLESVKGTKAAFKMTDDLLYVRAKIESTKPAVRKEQGKPDFQTAWTQPVR